MNNDLRVRRFTQEATAIFNFIESDIGRPLQNLVTNLSYAGMIADLTDVLDKLIAGWVNPICLASSLAVKPSSLTARKQSTLRGCTTAG